MSQISETKTDAILRLPQVRRITGLSRSSIYALQGSRQFPQSVKLCPRAVGWLESEIREWLLARVSERGARRFGDGSP
jgi:prophage regulatory protein